MKRYKFVNILEWCEHGLIYWPRTVCKCVGKYESVNKPFTLNAVLCLLKTLTHVLIYTCKHITFSITLFCIYKDSWKELTIVTYKSFCYFFIILRSQETSNYEINLGHNQNKKQEHLCLKEKSADMKNIHRALWHQYQINVPYKYTNLLC